jgi:bla regulator protein blaR1
MNGLELALTWTLIHSLWISLACLFLVNVASIIFRASKIRRLLKIGAITLFSVSVLAVFFRQLFLIATFESASIISLQFVDADSAVPTWLDQIKLWISANSMIISTVWASGLLFGISRFVYNRNVLSKYKASGLPCTDDTILTNMEAIGKNLGIKRKVCLMVSSLVDSPMTVGFLKPIIYLPLGLISGFNSNELDTILLHELSHIKRNDYVLNLFLVIIETIFFFNPFVILLVKDLRNEMEYVCDDEVLERHNEISYAKALIKLQEINISNQVALAAKNNNSEFKTRIERMINPKNNKVSPKLGLVVILLTSLFVSSAFIYNAPKEELPMDEIVIQEVKQDTLKFETRELMRAYLKEKGSEVSEDQIITVKGERILFLKGRNDALKKADKMMVEVQKELIKDGILNEDKQKITLMFQYSDVLNGKSALGDKYEKYKGILNKYFPGYDSFATTRVFRFK